MNNIYCHRGLYNNNNKTIENTIPAFKKALLRKLPIELDIRLTKDNVIVVFHDDTLERLTKGRNKKQVRELTYQELRVIKLLDEDIYIPTLKEVLSLIEGEVALLIEIKKVDNYTLLFRELDKLLLEYNGLISIESFDPFLFSKLAKTSLNRYKKGLLITDRNKGLKKYFYHLFIYHYFIKKADLDFLAVPKSLISVTEKSSNLPLFIWTVKTKEEYLKYSQKNYTLICDERAL